MTSLTFTTLLVILTFSSAFCASRTFSGGDCIRVSFDVQLTVEYTQDNKTSSRDVTLPENVNATWDCTEDTAHSLNLAFDGNTLVFTFNADKSKNVDLKLSYTFTPSQMFPNASKDAVTVSQKQPLDLKITSTENKSYMCNALQSLELTAKLAKLTAVFKNMQLQAFSLKNKTFGAAEECPQDHPTTAEPITTLKPNTTLQPITTPAPTSTTPKPTTPQVYNYTVHDGPNIICLYLETGLELNITYDTVKNTTSVVPFLLGQADSDGECGNDTESLTLTYEEANITMTFTLVLNADNIDLQHVTLAYTLTKFSFPDAKDSGATKNLKTAELKKTWQYTQGDKAYFTCKANQNIPFADSETVLITDKLKLKAFNKNDKPDLTGADCDQSRILRGRAMVSYAEVGITKGRN